MAERDGGSGRSKYESKYISKKTLAIASAVSLDPNTLKPIRCTENES